MFNYNRNTFKGQNFEEFKNAFLADAEYNEIEQNEDAENYYDVETYYGDEWTFKVENGIIVEVI